MLGDGRIVDKNTAGGFDGCTRCVCSLTGSPLTFVLDLFDVLKYQGTAGRLRFCGAETCVAVTLLLSRFRIQLMRC